MPKRSKASDGEHRCKLSYYIIQNVCTCRDAMAAGVYYRDWNVRSESKIVVMCGMGNMFHIGNMNDRWWLMDEHTHHFFFFLFSSSFQFNLISEHVRFFFISGVVVVLLSLGPGSVGGSSLGGRPIGAIPQTVSSPWMVWCLMDSKWFPTVWADEPRDFSAPLCDICQMNWSFRPI